MPREEIDSNNSPFTVTTTPPGLLKLKPGEKGTFSFTVTSLEGPDKKREVVLQALLIDAAGKTMEVDWLEAGPSRTATLTGGETMSVTIEAKPTTKVAPGAHSIKLAIADNADPSDTFAYSAPVTCEIEKPVVTPPPPGGGLPKWLIPAIIGAVVVIAGVVVLVLVLRNGDEPLALGQACTAESPPCAQGLVCAAEQQKCLRPTGGACTADTDCETSKCTNAACVAQPTKAGDPCDTTCPEPLQCSPTKHCGEQIGRPCEQNVQCFSGLCDTGRCVDAAVGVLGEAITKVSATPASWATVLTEVLGKLTAPAQAPLRNDVKALLDAGTAAVRIGPLCTNDIVGGRVATGLDGMKDKLLGAAPAAPTPLVCGSTPAAVEFAKWQANQIPSVRLTGFDLGAPLRVALAQTNGTSVAGFTAPGPGGFQATIDLGPTGVRLTALSQRIIVLTTEQPPLELAVINVVQPQPKICQERDMTVSLVGSVNFVASNHTRGDRDFVAHGPRVNASLRIDPRTTRVGFSVSMSAVETISDFTTISGIRTGELSLSPPVPANHRITAIKSATVSTAAYIDSGHSQDTVRPTTGPVSEFVFVGDTDGPDVGRTALVSAKFRTIVIHVIETGSCVPRT